MLLTTLLLTTGGDPRPELLLFLKSAPGLELLDGLSEPRTTGPMPDLVILDASTPGPNDGALLRELRSQLPGVRFLVLISSLAQSEPVLATGADRVLLTGFSTAEFFQVLNELSMPSQTSR